VNKYAEMNEHPGQHADDNDQFFINAFANAFSHPAQGEDYQISFVPEDATHGFTALKNIFKTFLKN